jgi:transcriptional regulator with XRE-family HTH domain
VALKELRVRSHLTVNEVAIQIKIPDLLILLWEAGKNPPKLEPANMLKLCTLYQCSLEELTNSTELSIAEYERNVLLLEQLAKRQEHEKRKLLWENKDI